MGAVDLATGSSGVRFRLTMIVSRVVWLDRRLWFRVRCTIGAFGVFASFLRPFGVLGADLGGMVSVQRQEGALTVRLENLF